MTDQRREGPAEVEVRIFSEFLESVPPGTTLPVGPAQRVTSSYEGALIRLRLPEVRLFCNQDTCNGYRFYSTDEDVIAAKPGGSKFGHITYHCRNCRRGTKIYSLWMTASDSGAMTAMKFGEWPEFGPPTPSRVITLIGPDRELFLKGRRSENQGLGIDAFGYYRRVVENQKNRILEQIIKASEKLGADPELLAELRAAQNETRFSNAIAAVKHGIPQALLVNGHNPLSLLHTALSNGLHAESDEDCLELATSIRIVLTELAERMGQALKDEAELARAVSRLLDMKGKKANE